MIKLVNLLKETILLEYNKSQLEYVAVKLNVEDRNEFNSLMNALNAQDIVNLSKYIIKIILYKTDSEIESLLQEKNIPYKIIKL